MDTVYREILTKIGWLTLTQCGESLTALSFGQRGTGETLPDTPLMRETEKQLTAYLDGRLRRFDLPLSPSGTAFRLRCWEALMQIPYGETWSYSRQASFIGRPKAVRAVGQANHHNPLPILIPCHRVVGQNGSLTGYAGGLEIKQQLLDLESKAVCGG